MKLAEALLLRADMQRKLESLRERIGRNTVTQEGEKPSEDPNVLLDQVRTICGQLERLIFGINEANLQGRTGRNRTLTEALAQRDVFVLQHSIFQAAASSAAKPPERYGTKEIRWVKTVDVAALQKSVDEMAKALRELNAEIQAANWQIEVPNM
jgi:cob(I)alamin adenosyltransferase